MDPDQAAPSQHVALTAADLADAELNKESLSNEPDDAQSLRAPNFIVGVGASAGGLESLEKLFERLPADSGMAFVVIQHLSPDFKSLMDELLGRKTRMPVVRAEDGMEVRPNHVYLLPPKKEMIVNECRLRLADKDPHESLSLPIDHFFRSLAQDASETAVAVILSGSGRDGSRGLVDIHEAGGVTLVETEETAKFDGMPMAAQETGLVDFVGTPEELAGALVEIARRSPATQDRGRLEAVLRPTAGADKAFELLRKKYQLDFSQYKPSTVGRRMERRLALLGYTDIDQYAERLRDDPDELDSLYKDLLIGVTGFFRDADSFRRLETEIIPGLISGRRPDEDVRVWVAACATGEEAYSLAILLREGFERAGRPPQVKIFATDVHRASLERANVGVYTEEQLEAVSSKRLSQHFERSGEGYRIHPDVRRLVVFAPHNVLKDAPFTNLDLITCRNLLIYFQPNAQKKVLSVFHFGLRTGGVLFLGGSESPGALADEFETIDQHSRLYRKRRNIRLPVHLRMPLAAAVPATRPDGPGLRLPQRYPDAGLFSLYDRLLDRFMPPSFLIDERREVIDTFGGAERFLRPKRRRPSNDLLDQLEPEVRTAVAGALQRAIQHGQAVRFAGVRLRTRDGEQTCRLEVEPLHLDRLGVPHYLVSLAPIEGEAEPKGTARPEPGMHEMGDISAERVVQLEDELRYTKENLQAAIEELETSNEELQASNEELVASNEELQSTNEELHSVNEELYTVNAEHKRKIEELADLNRDMAHLLECSDVATVFLDRELRIRKFTPRVAEVFDLLEGDVGRTLGSFTHRLRHAALDEDLRHVLLEGVRVEREVTGQDGRSFFMRVLPYQKDGDTQGVVLTLTDVSALAAARGNVSRLAAAVECSDDAILAKDVEGTITAWNRGAERLYGYSAQEAVGRHISLIVPESRHEELEGVMRAARQGRGTDHLETRRRRKDGSEIDVWVTISPVFDPQGQVVGMSAVARDLTQRKELERTLRESEERYRNIIDSALDAVIAIDERGIVKEWNESAAFILGFSRQEAVGRPLSWLIIPERFRKPFSDGMDRFLASGEGPIFNRRVEIQALRRDGCEFLAELTVVPVRTAEGHIFTAFLRDVTARKRAENLLQRKALEASLLHQATAVAAETDSFEQALQSCVTIVCELTGWPVGHAFIRPTPESEQLVPTNIWHLSHPERYRKFVAVTEQSAFKRGEGIPGIIWKEGKAAWIPNVHKSDNFPRAKIEPELEITAAFGFPVFVRGELEAVLEFFHPQEMPLDENLLLVAQAVGEQVGRVMERKRTRLALARQADELLQMNTELTRSNKELDDFAYIASHDLREPLRGIQNYATFLIEDYGEAFDEQGREKLETMRRLTQRLDELIESLLKFSRVGRLNLDVQPVDLNAVAADACDSLQTLLTENLVEVRLPNLLPMVACDRVHAGEVFVNLISNAVKYNDKSHKLVEIGSIEVPGDDELLAAAMPPELADCAAPILYVRDNGIGIRDRHVESIFKIFKRLHGRDQFGGGSGAGLTIVKKIIERHGGRIWVDSTVGEGTTFYFVLGEYAQPGSHPAPQKDASTSGEYALGAV